MRRWVWTLSFDRRRRQGNHASLHKTMTAKNWETNLNEETLLESKVATRWIVVNYENRTVRSFYNAWQRKGVWVAGFEEAVTVATSSKSWKHEVKLPKKNVLKPREWDLWRTSKVCRIGYCVLFHEIMKWTFKKTWNQEIIKTWTFINFQKTSKNFLKVMKSWNFAVSRRLRCNGAQVWCEFSKIMKSQLFEFLRCVVAEVSLSTWVWSWAF